MHASSHEPDCSHAFIHLMETGASSCMPTPRPKRHTRRFVVACVHNADANTPGAHRRDQNFALASLAASTSVAHTALKMRGFSILFLIIRSGECWVIDSWEGAPCRISSSGACVTSPDYPGNYPTSSRCTFTPIAGVPIIAEMFGLEPAHSGPPLECAFDFLEIDGVRSCGGLNQLSNTSNIVPSGSPIIFASDDDITGAGFSLCQYTPPAPPTPPLPPFAPPPTSPPPLVPGTCNDDCGSTQADNGICEDGGPGSVEPRQCPVGTDW